MDEEQLALVEEGLNRLIKRFKQNLNEGDQERLQATLDAKKAIRKVILAVAIKGDIKEINPIVVEKKGAGWEVTDFNDKIIRYHA
jgi:hypothetical protein